MDTKTKAKIRTAIANSQVNVSLLKEDASALLTALDSAEKEKELQTTLAGGWEIDALARKREIADLETENTRLREALKAIKNKAWDYTSPAKVESVRVFAGIIHEVASEALTQKGGG